MISAKQDASLIISTGNSEIGCYSTVYNNNFSRAILVALARAFADCADLKHYLQRCYEIVIKNKEMDLPSSYLRLDVSHIKIISNWECLQHLPSKVRQFYLRCITQAYKMQNLNELRSFLTSVLVVALSEDVGCINDISVPLRHVYNVLIM